MKERVQEGVEVVKALPVVALCYLAYGIAYIPMEVYMGIRARSDENLRDDMVAQMVASAYLNGTNGSRDLSILLLPKAARRDAQEAIKEALEAHKVRDRFFDALSDEEMVAYAGNHAKSFRFLTLPAIVGGERRDN